MAEKKVAFLSDGYTENFVIPEGDDYPEVRGTFRPPTDMETMEFSRKAEGLEDDDVVAIHHITCEEVTRRVRTWDVRDETGTEVDATVEHMERLPIEVVGKLLAAVAGDKARKRLEADSKN